MLDRAEYRAILRRQREEDARIRLLFCQSFEEGYKQGLIRGELCGQIKAYEQVLGRKPSSRAKLDAMTNDQLTRRVELLSARALASRR